MAAIEVYFEANCTKPINEKDKSKDNQSTKYERVNLNSTLLEVLQHKFYIMPQYPVLNIISSKSDFKDSFLNQI